MELILTERSDGSYGPPALHGIHTASVVGPEPVPMDWILQTVLSPPESEYEMRLIQPAEYVCIGEKKLDLWIADVYAITLFCDEIPAEWRNA